MKSRISKTASVRERDLRPALFYQSAREGMHDFLNNVLTSPEDGVLLPAYIGRSQREGSGVLDPVVAAGARVGFYDIQSDLSVDIESIERCLRNERYQVIVLIHYFGRTDLKVAAVREIADRHGAVLVEDLAHGFYSSLGPGPAGRTGHVSLFSLHKMFPLEDGGLVSYAEKGLVTGQRQTRPELANRILDYDWLAIAARRRDNFEQLSLRLRSLPECGDLFELIWPELGEDDVPQTLPVRITGNSRDAIYAGMNEEGFGMVSLYHTLVEAVSQDFEELNDLALHIINFPVHQDVDPEWINPMVDAFSRNLLDNEGRSMTGNGPK